MLNFFIIAGLATSLVFILVANVRYTSYIEYCTSYKERVDNCQPSLTIDKILLIIGLFCLLSRVLFLFIDLWFGIVFLFITILVTIIQHAVIREGFGLTKPGRFIMMSTDGLVIIVILFILGTL